MSPPYASPSDADWERRVRASFGRQGAMQLIGASIARLAPGRCTLAVPFRPELAH